MEKSLQQAFSLLKNGEFDRAEEICEQIIATDPTCAKAYLGILMAQLHVKDVAHLKECKTHIEDNGNYQNALYFGDDELVSTLKKYSQINRKEVIYNSAIEGMKKARTEKEFIDIAKQFEKISEYKDAKTQITACYQYVNKIAVATVYGEDEKRKAKQRKAKKTVKVLILSVVSFVLVFSMIVSFGVFNALVKVFSVFFGDWSDDDYSIEKESLYSNHGCEIETENFIDCVAISASGKHIIGLKSDGTVVASCDCDIQEWKDIIAIKTYSDTIYGLRKDGRVIKTNGDDNAQNILAWSDIVAVEENEIGGVLGLKKNGTVVLNGSSAWQDEVHKWNGIVALSADEHIVALKSDGTVVSAGDNIDGRCNVQEWTDIIAISAGESHTVGLKSDGTVIAVGNNLHGSCDVQEWTDIIAISAGESHTVGLKADGTVVAVGRNAYNQCNVQNWTNIIAIETTETFTVGLKADGTVVTTFNQFTDETN